MHPDNKNYFLYSNLKKIVTFSLFIAIAGAYFHGCHNQYKYIKHAVYYKDSVNHVRDSLEYRLK